MKKNLFSLLAFFSLIVAISSCKKKPDNPSNQVPELTENTAVKGYNIFTKINGIWDGSLASGTSLPNFPSWVVDFRPISASQISAKNELDSLNDIFMSMFIVLHNNEYKVGFRNGGGFAGMQRISYMVVDSVSETSTVSYYRFSDFVKGKKRAYTSFDFHDDSLIVKTYTNKNNTLDEPVMHFIWRSKLKDNTSFQAAATNFSFPKKTLVKNFSETFKDLLESIYYQTTGDPYPEGEQPYLGISNISYSFSPTITPNPNKNVLLVITTQPLFNGTTFLSQNIKYRSRYVSVPVSDPNFVFNYMHPGTYYLYAICDNDGNLAASSGDYMSLGNTTFTLNSKETISKNVLINFTIP